MTAGLVAFLHMLGVTFAATLAVVPGVVRWWTDRRLSADDPALPERLMSRRTTGAPVIAVVIALLLVLTPGHAPWAVPVAILGLVAAGHPLRRRVFAETWSLPAYLWWTGRLAVAVWGYWVLLAATPALVAVGPRPALPIGLALAALLAAWNQWYSRVLLWLLGARPFAPADWPPGFARVLAGARVPAPRLWRTGPPGSTLANAIALPSLRGTHVLFTDALLDRLDDDEEAAILAHEVSHLELFTRSLLVRWLLSSLALILGAALLVPAVDAVAPAWLGIALAAWGAIVFATLVTRSLIVRAQETPSDRRAVELCGDAEAVVSGLVKLHETAKLPRRWALAFEEHATHPSLARRIRAIRMAAGASEASRAAATFPIVLRGSGDGTAVVIDADRVRHLSGVAPDVANVDALLASASSAVALPWTDVAELRVDARRDRPPQLVVGNVRGQRWTSTLSADRIADVQAVLDTVDDRLPEALPVHGAHRRRARLVLIAVLTVAVLAFSLSSSMIVIGLALLVPSPGALLAAGVAACTTALVGIAQSASRVRMLLDLLVIVPGAWAVWLALRWRSVDDTPDRVVHALTGLAAVALWILGLVYSRGDLFDLHTFVRSMPGTVALPFALAAGWTVSREARFRRGVAVPLLLGAIGVIISSSFFVDAALRDPLRADASRPAVLVARLHPLAQAVVPADISELRLSPSGRTFAVVPELEDEESPELPLSTFGDFSGRRGTVRALAVNLVDDAGVVAVERAGERLVIRARPLDGPERVTWEVALPIPDWGTFTVDPTTRRWRYATTAARSFRQFEGVIGSPDVRDRPFSVPGAGDRAFTRWLGSDGRPIGLVYDYPTRGTWSIAMNEILGLRWRMPVMLRLPDGGVIRSRFDGGCYEATPGEPVVCVAHDGARTYTWAWDGQSLEPVALFDGELTVQGRDASGWITAWRGGQLRLVSLRDGKDVEVPGACGTHRCLAAATYTGHVLGGLLTRGSETVVATFRVDGLSSPSP